MNSRFFKDFINFWLEICFNKTLVGVSPPSYDHLGEALRWLFCTYICTAKCNDLDLLAMAAYRSVHTQTYNHYAVCTHKLILHTDTHKPMAIKTNNSAINLTK